MRAAQGNAALRGSLETARALQRERVREYETETEQHAKLAAVLEAKLQAETLVRACMCLCMHTQVRMGVSWCGYTQTHRTTRRRSHTRWRRTIGCGTSLRMLFASTRVCNWKSRRRAIVDTPKRRSCRPIIRC